MDSRLKSKWLKALRSGKFRQGDGALKDSRGQYCCLGVLAEITGVKWAEGVPYKNGERISLEGGGFYLSPSFCGLSKKTQISLGNMNDGANKWVRRGRQSFKQIADYIESRIG